MRFRMNQVLGAAMIFLISSITGCDADPEPPATGQRKQQSVFNERNVDQARGDFLRAEQDFDHNHDPGSKEIQRAYFRAHATRATAIFRSNPCSVAEPNGAGTAVLTAPTRMITAFHNVQGDTTKSTVTFGGEDSYFYDGRFVADDRADIPYDDDTQFRHPSDERNPLLVNRLFAMGLEDWARRTAVAGSIRKNLRTWTTVPYQGSVAQTWQGQGIITSWDPITYTVDEGADIAILKVIQESGAEYFEGEATDAGNVSPFPLIGPGVFFDYVEVAPYQIFPLSPELPLAGAYTTKWPSDSGARTPLAARAGYLSAENTVFQPSNKCHTDDHVFSNNSKVTVDFIAGTSGGVVFAPDMDEGLEDESLIRKRWALGVISGVVHDKWSDDHFSVDEPSPSNFGNGNTISQIPAGAPLDALRDIPDQPVIRPADRPICQQGENHESCFECVAWNDNGHCSRFHNIPASSGEDEPICPYLGVEEDDERSRQRGNGERYVQCAFRPDGTPFPTSGRSPGLVVGFVGGLIGWDSAITETENISIGSLMAVCAPATATPYVENWQLLNTKGAWPLSDVDSIQGRFGWLRMEDITRYTYELRNDDSRIRVHPTSMKLCPPNYFLHGAQFLVDDNCTRVIGLSDLFCRKPDGFINQETSSDNTPTEVVVSLSSDHIDGYDAWTIGGYEFSIDQRIGSWSEDSTTRRHVLKCEDPDFPFVDGLETVHDDEGRLTNVYLTCQKSP